MAWHFNASAQLYLMTGVVALACTWVFSQRRRSRFGWERSGEGIRGSDLRAGEIRNLYRFMVCVAVWSLLVMLEFSASSTRWKVIFAQLEFPFLAALTCWALLFAVSYAFPVWRMPAWLNRFLWLIVLVMTGMVWSNNLHRLVWTGFELEAANGEYLTYLVGPLHPFVIGTLYLFALLGLATLLAKVVISRGEERKRAVVITIGLSLPPLVEMLYHTFPLIFIQGTDLVPLAYSACCLLLAGTLISDLENGLEKYAHALETSVERLEAELQVRQRVEAELRQTRNTLAERITGQANKLMAFYELLLLPEQTVHPSQVLARLVGKVKAISGCQAAAIHQRREGEAGFWLLIQEGMAQDLEAETTLLPETWLYEPTLQRTLPRTIPDLGAGEFPEREYLGVHGAYVGLPVYWKGEMNGVLSLFWNEAAEFQVEDIVIYSAIGDLVDVILENLRLQENIRTTASIQERQRVARELHDSVTQSLHSLSLGTELTLNRLRKGQIEQLQPALEQLQRIARQSLVEMRLLLFELRPSALQERGLVEALQLRLEAVEQRIGIQTRLEVHGALPCSADLEAELYGIASEALNNTLKHAEASRVWVTLACNEERLCLAVEDDGRGVDGRALQGGGLGMHTMAERSAKLGGRLSIGKRPEGGTRVEVVI